MKRKFRESVIMQIENVKTAFEGILPSGLVADIWARIPFTVPLEQISGTDLAKDEVLDLCNSQKCRLILNQ
jgi:hypothetical protein